MDTFSVKTFQDLTPAELYDVLQLRCRIFIVEQRCLFVDPDGYDQQCLHVLLYRGESLIGYARVVPPAVIYPEASIGRVSSQAPLRGLGIGKLVMAKALEVCEAHFPGAPIRLMAQYYLLDFYKSFGFAPSGDIYIEDDIEHIDMYLYETL